MFAKYREVAGDHDVPCNKCEFFDEGFQEVRIPILGFSSGVVRRCIRKGADRKKLAHGNGSCDLSERLVDLVEEESSITKELLEIQKALKGESKKDLLEIKEILGPLEFNLTNLLNRMCEIESTASDFSRVRNKHLSGEIALKIFKVRTAIPGVV